MSGKSQTFLDINFACCSSVEDGSVMVASLSCSTLNAIERTSRRLIQFRNSSASFPRTNQAQPPQHKPITFAIVEPEA
jgi:hypothetical protein